MSTGAVYFSIPGDCAIITSGWTSQSSSREWFFLAASSAGKDFAGQLAELFGRYESERHSAGLAATSGVTAKVFLSDAANQEGLLRAHPAVGRLIDAGVALTVVEQPPVGGKLGLLAYHVERPQGAEQRRPLAVPGTKDDACGLEIGVNGYRFVHLRNLRASEGGDAAAQTERLFGVPQADAPAAALSLSEVIRTWLYIHDIDTNYLGVSGARNRVFERFGITAERGFPASTGIQGRSVDARDVLLMDVFAIQGLQPGQSRPLEAPTHMNRTVEYGVTFERGRAVVYGDRRHLFVSGTASIDNRGQILFPGDAARQTERAVENIAALLGSAGSRLEDLRYALVYLRDPADAPAVEAALAGTPLGDLPRILLHAPVCRPGWLVELEGIAIDGAGDSRFAPF